MDDSARVLIVAGDKAGNYARQLVRAGFDTTIAASTGEALHLLEAAKGFDVVITDLGIPVSRCLRELEMIQQLRPDLPLFLLIDKVDNEMTVEALEAGVTHCLVKPVQPGLLTRSIHAALRRPRRAKASAPSRGGQVGLTSVSATEAKNAFAQVLDSALQGEPVVITKHDRPRAVLLAFEAYVNLASERSRQLDALRGEFDALLAGMQGADARRRMKSAFAATPAELGKGAVVAARKRT